MNKSIPKVLLYAKSQYPELEPIDGLRMLAKTHTSRQIAELCGQAWSTVSTRCKSLGVICIEQDAKTTSRNIRAAHAKNENGVMSKMANYITKYHAEMKPIDAVKMLLSSFTPAELGKKLEIHRSCIVSFCKIRGLDYLIESKQ